MIGRRGHPPVEPEPVTPDPPAPGGRPLLRQRWTDLAYLHWRYPAEVVQRLLPPGVTVDRFDDAAWVGLIPFVMRDVSVGPAPPLPWLGTFVEVNVRTYVVDPQGRRAVWFFSLDVPRAAIVGVARTAFALPYCWAAAEHRAVGDRHHYRVRRRWPRGPGRADIGYSVGDALAADDVDELDHFLTARWGLVTAAAGRLLHGQVTHPRWPLHEAVDVRVDENLVRVAGLPAPSGPPRARCSPGVPVEVERFRRVPTGPGEGRRDA